LHAGKFSPGRRVCRECRAEAERERRRQVRAEYLEALDEDERERFRMWQARRRMEWKEENAFRRRNGLPELPPPDLEPGWLERLQARVRAKMEA
jgi:hypothetical protein